ncbi:MULTISPECIES: lipoprotein LenA [Leptospira]|uniref:Lipoprotein n=4 Tax=Leptospira borgpetersenii TaxID=174 RepID=A0ABN0HVF8_LEPBO|nr:MULTISPECIES: lipoprotein LenA [Leptospira]EMO09547.1 putative lipoprotein [Leptospira borgpetersenii str. Noumea 25]ALO24389.1 putative lipoprotein [Leptospira borgpetersenii serovar Ballum]ANG99570.2 Putative lipoprotein [Leptospira borgpetersenii str. 4E]AXX14190.1 lipoprotein LenA [Leptospira borgpetersenii serovar Ceylonica]EKP12704.1 putative lipoprotein [Leptospira borgpetersenii str. 200801926]
MKSIELFLILSFALLMIGCKKEEKKPEAQILGTRFANFDQWIYKVPGSEKKEDQVSLVYGMEEVTGLETVDMEVTTKKGNSTVTFIKVKTVENKEGYAPIKNFSENVYFVLNDSDDAFVKPTITANTKGKLKRGMYCLEQEVIREFSKVTCYDSILTEDKLNNYYDVWIKTVSVSLSKDALLGETVKLLKKSSQELAKYNSASDEEKNKILQVATESLKKAAAKQDEFTADVNALAGKFGIVLQ